MALRLIEKLGCLGTKWSYAIFECTLCEKQVQKFLSTTAKNCGCIKEENKKHSRLKNTWWKIKSRCFNFKDTSYKNYGYRGIKICDEWENDFESFKSWSLRNGYKENLTIDRINNDGNYTPENCRWIPGCENSRWKRSTKLNFKKARIIRGLFFASCHNSDSLAKMFSVSKSCIEGVIYQRNWRDRDGRHDIDFQ